MNKNNFMIPALNIEHSSRLISMAATAAEKVELLSKFARNSTFDDDGQNSLPFALRTAQLTSGPSFRLLVFQSSMII